MKGVVKYWHPATVVVCGSINDVTLTDTKSFSTNLVACDAAAAMNMHTMICTCTRQDHAQDKTKNKQSLVRIQLIILLTVNGRGGSIT
jgi:hypothetical protein